MVEMLPDRFLALPSLMCGGEIGEGEGGEEEEDEDKREGDEVEKEDDEEDSPSLSDFLGSEELRG